MAAQALGTAGAVADEAVPALLVALSDSDWCVRFHAATSLLEAFGQVSSEIVAGVAVAFGMDCEKCWVWKGGYASGSCWTAVKVLSGCGLAGIPGLLTALAHSARGVRQSAVGALETQVPVVANVLSLALADESSRVRVAAAVRLAKLGLTTDKAVSVLSEALGDEAAEVRQGAAEALGYVGAAAVPALVKALRNGDTTLRRSAAEALGNLGASGHEAVSALIERLDDSEWSVRAAAAAALGKMGRAAAEAAPQLARLLQDSVPEVRKAAAEALAAVLK